MPNLTGVEEADPARGMAPSSSPRLAITTIVRVMVLVPGSTPSVPHPTLVPSPQLHLSEHRGPSRGKPVRKISHMELSPVRSNLPRPHGSTIPATLRTGGG